MGSSLVLQGGAASAKALREIITQNHTFTKGTVVRWDTNTNTYVRAQADSAANAEVAGVVSDVPGTTAFEITYKGVIEGIVAGPAGVSAPVMFLSSTVAGGLETSPPSAVGTVVKPVLTRNTSGTGYLVMNYLGTQIGGSSTIAVDEIQPVGTVMPFAGSAIPDTWLECNGASYAVGNYPQLYDRVRYRSGVRAPMYGHVFTVTTSSVSYAGSSTVSTIQTDLTNGVTVFIRNRDVLNTQDIVARILSISGSGNSLTITAQVVPVYSSTLKNFSIPNSFLTTGANAIRGIGRMGTDGVVGSDAQTLYCSAATVSTVAITHFNVPDLRGRFALGINSGSITDIDGDSTLNSAIGTYGIASLGGEESHTLTGDEMPSHTHAATVTVTDPGHKHIQGAIEEFPLNGTDPNVSGSWRNNSSNTNVPKAPYTFNSTTGISVSVTNTSTGSNTPHNNMPPYLAVRYIIKAKPYTRAAIIDGLELPYSSLLVRGTVEKNGDIRSRSIGGRDDDLVFYTNTSGDSDTGTERIRISGVIGNVGIGKTPNAGISLDVNGSGAFRQLGVGLSTTPTVTFDVSGTTRFTGSVGVNTASPSVALDVVGALRVSDFDGSNVLVKPRNTPTSIANIGTVGMVGQVIPLHTAAIHPYYQHRAQTAPIPFGKWFVFFTTEQDPPSGQSENPGGVMAGVWDVPANQYLFFATAPNYSTQYMSPNRSGIYYKYFTDITNITTHPARTSNILGGNMPDATWTHMTLANGMATDLHGYDPSGMPANFKGLIYHVGPAENDSYAFRTPIHIIGYAMRIG